MSQVGVGIQARPSDLNRGIKLQHLNESQILQGKSKKYNRLEKVSSARKVKIRLFICGNRLNGAVGIELQLCHLYTMQFKVISSSG